MSRVLSASTSWVQKALDVRGVDSCMLESLGAGRTAHETAQTSGCRIEQIANSLVFVAGE